MTDPFETTVPPGQSRLALRDYPGCCAVIFFGGIHPAVLTTAGRGGYKPAARVNVVLLNGFDGGKIFEDAMLFNSMVVTSLRQVEPGKAIVVHIEVKNAGGQPTPYIEEADENELELARQWYRANPEQWAELLKGTMENFYAGERSIAQQQGGYQQQQQGWGGQQPQQQWGQQQPQRSAPANGPGRSGPPRSQPAPPPSAPPRGPGSISNQHQPVSPNGPPPPPSRQQQPQDPWVNEHPQPGAVHNDQWPAEQPRQQPYVPQSQQFDDEPPF